MMKMGWSRSRVRSAAGLVCAALLVVTILPGLVLADDKPIPVDAKGLPLWEKATWNDFPVRLELRHQDEVDALLRIVPIASFHREQIKFHFDSPKNMRVIFEPRVTEAEATALEQAGYSFERLEDVDRIGREAVEAAWADRYARGETLTKDSRLAYPTHPEIGTILADLAATYPTLARTFTWGQSTEGRDQWGLVISDDVQNSEVEPEVRLASSIHGDETTGIVLTIEFAKYLLNNYGQTGYEDCTNLVDNYEIHLMPLHNPYGYVADQRENVNGEDLNRNFPEPTGPEVTEQENINFMNYANNYNFVISLMYHGGALVANYPWDHTYTLHPDEYAFQAMSLEYTTTNLPMYNSPSFSQGITNGAAWYRIDGGLQDWSLFVTGCVDVTLEVSNTKWPPASELQTFWDQNRESMMNYVKCARYGINGVVTGSDTGLPLDATVTLTSRDAPVRTDPAHGDYYKVLETGTYELTFSAYGYIDQTISGVSTSWGTPTVLDVVMDPVAHGDLSGTVTNGTAGLDAQVRIYSHPVGTYVTTANASAAAGGAYDASLVYGQYRLEAVATDHLTVTDYVTIGATPQVVDFVLSGTEEVILFTDDFEGDLSQWIGDWGISSPAEGHDSANSMNESPDGTYPDYADLPMAMAEGMNLSNAMSGEVSFWAKWEIENSWDACFFEVSTDGGSNWTPLSTAYTNAASGQGAQVPGGTPVFDNVQASWVYNTVDLAPWIGEADVRFRFRLASDSSQRKDGFYVDDFEILAIKEITSSPVPGAELFVADVKAWPNPFNPQTTVGFVNPRAGHAEVVVYDVQGRLVRTLVSETLSAGRHSVLWDGRSDAGAATASGVYFAQMRSGKDVATTKLMLVK